MTSSLFHPPHSRWLCRTAIFASLLFLAAGAFAADEKNTELVCIRNRPLVSVSLNKIDPYYMLLDFSIPQTILSCEVAEYLGLETIPGLSPEIRKTRLDSFRCGNRPSVSSACVVMDLAPLCGLLGATVAGIVNPRVFGPEIVLDIGHGGFVARGAADAALHDEKDPRTVKMSVTGDLPTVPALLNGAMQRSCVLDTTFGGTVAVSEALLAELGIALDAAPKLVVRTLPGAVNDPVGRVQVRLKSVRVGAVEIRNPLCAVEPGNQPPCLGIGFLRHFRAILNFDQGLVRLETDAASPPCDAPVIGCGLVLAAFRDDFWTVWIALNSPADRAGIPPDSVLLAVNGKDMKGASHAEAFASLPSEEGQEAEITVSHGEEVRTVSLKAETLL